VEQRSSLDLTLNMAAGDVPRRTSGELDDFRIDCRRQWLPALPKKTTTAQANCPGRCGELWILD
jgi:hypothetical protein